jgi:hypothetical protein
VISCLKVECFPLCFDGVKLMQALIYGSKSYAKLVAQIAKECGYQIEGYIDDFGGEGLGSYVQNRDRILKNGIPSVPGNRLCQSGSTFSGSTKASNR